MIGLVSVLLIGSGLVFGSKLVKKSRTSKNQKNNLTPSDKSASKDMLLQRVDDRYQAFCQHRLDPLFGSKQRSQQLQEFYRNYSIREIDINRRLGYSVANTSLAILGYFLFAPLSWLSAVGLILIVLPMFKRSLFTLWKEKRLKYNLVAILSILSSLAAGYYVISSLMAIAVFAAFKMAVRAEAISHSDLERTFTLHTPASVWIQRETGIEVKIPFSQLSVGDIIVVSAGQTIPADGCIAEGMGTIDQHILTGEAQPVEKMTGDQVFANTMLLTGKLYVRVKQTGDETAAAQIGHILNNMTTNRLDHEARSEHLADRLALPLLSASGLALITIGPAGAAAIMNSGFGSIMYISGPLSMLSHLNLASHHGILIKDGRSLEKLDSVDTVVFDKTGTLTMEQPEVNQVYSCAHWSESEILAFAAVAEDRQTHPVAKAILSASKQNGLQSTEPDSIAYTVGFGVQVEHQGHTIQVGSQRFMQQSEVIIPECMESVSATSQAEGNSIVFVSVDGQLAGALTLQPQLRSDTQALVDKLQQRGLKLCILSGDHLQPTQYLAQRLGIDEVYAEVLPQGKAELISQLQENGRTICFVGDGINDAIALRQADVSVSLCGASTVATDNAQIVLMSQSLQQLDQLFEIGSSLNKNLDQTMKLAFIPGGVLIGGVFLLHFGMTAALLLYSGGLAAAVTKALSPLDKLLLDKIP
ncbi:MAG: heavy metal translocating P-type ATPase [Mariprofundales bacterium]